MRTQHIAAAWQFEDVLSRTERALAVFSKDNCPACRMLDKAIERFEEDFVSENVTLLVVKLEDLGEDFFRGADLRQTPTLALYRRGVLVARMPGYTAPAKIVEAVRTHLR